MWSAGGAAVFDAMAGTLRELGDQQDDARLRVILRRASCDQLADDLERGDHMIVPFLRWLEERMPELTAMMQEESRGLRASTTSSSPTSSPRLFVHTARVRRSKRTSRACCVLPHARSKSSP